MSTSAAPKPATADGALVHHLPNGMVLLGEPSEAFESAAFSMLLPAGCRYESDERLGLASLTCEMILRGAGDRDSRQLVDDLDSLGAERGESVGVSQATFGVSTLAENLGPSLDIYADMVRRPHLPADQMEQGRQVLLQELRGVEDEPSQKLTNELRARHYPAPWGRPSCGDDAGLRGATIDDVRRFHALHYRPEGAILAAAGSFDWDALCDRVERLFGDWRGAGTPATPVERAPLGDTHVPYDSSQSHLGVAFASTPYKHPDYFQAWSAVGVLSGGMSSRLFTEVREKRGLCYTVYASLQTQIERAAVFCYAGTTAERAQETLDVLCGELERLAEGVTPQELSRLKARIKSALILQQESTSSRAGSLARDWRHLGRVRPLDELRRLIDAVTAETINDYLTRNPPRDFTTVTLGRDPLTRTK
ncbi:MAG: M16 family metallopeptidase [Lacipirellulaceae bacterium]